MKTDKETLNAIHPLAWDLVAHLHVVGGVAKQDMESMIDTICRYGFSGGVAGFVYDSDCVTFLRRTAVLEKGRMVMRDYADGIGEPLWRVASRTACTDHASEQQIEGDQVLQMNGARLLVADISSLTSRDYAWLASSFAWFVAQRVAYAFEDTDEAWRAGDQGDPERGSDGYGDMEGGTNE